jgi:methionyl-tRNA formyltransferase
MSSHPLKIAVFGQAPFGRDVTARIADAGHEIVAVHVPPSKGRPDPLAELAEERGWPLFRYKAYRRKGTGEPIAERVDEYLAVGAELNLMPFTTAILPPVIVDAPRLGSLCFHPSLLPAYRGGNALAWQIINGETESGVSVFQVDDGVDTGPLVVQKGRVPIEPTDNTVSLYYDKLYPLGVEAMVEAVEAVAAGTAKPTPQSEAGASFQGLVDDDVARIDWKKPGVEVDRLVRGCDPAPGAWAELAGETVRLFGSRFDAGDPGSAPGSVLGLDAAGERLRIAVDGGEIGVQKLRVGDGPKMKAAEAGVEGGARLA